MFKGMSNIYKQAQKMQKNMKKIQNELIKLEIQGQSGGGMVKVVVNGKKDPISIKINKEILNEDIDFIEDMVLAAMKNAFQDAEKISEEKMKSVTGGNMPNLNIPGF